MNKTNSLRPKLNLIATLLCVSCATTTNTNTPVQTTASTEQVVQSDANTPTEQEEASLSDATVTVAHTDITSAFTDPAFLAVIQGLTRNQILYADEVASITTLEIDDIEIRSLAGLEHLVGLEQLEVRQTSIEQMTLPELSSLHQLAVSGNSSLRTLTLPPSLSNLRHLKIRGDVVFRAIEARWAEIAPHLESLQISWLTQTHLTLPELPMLQSLEVLNDALGTLTLHNLPALQSLVVFGNRALRTLTLPALPALQTLQVSDNDALSTLSLSSLPALQTLMIFGNAALNTLSLPPSLSNLRHLLVGDDVMLRAIETRWAEIAPHLESLQISNLTQTHRLTLPALPALQELRVLGNGALRTLSLSEIPALQTLTMGGDALLTVGGNDALNELSLPPTLSNLRHLKIGGDVEFQAIETRWAEIAPHLESLQISNLTQTHLTLPELPMLQTLKIFGNDDLSTLSLSSLPALQELDVSWNRALRTLNLPSLPALQSLVVFLNDALGTLTLPSLPALQTLHAIDNAALRTLNLPSLPALQELKMSANNALRTLTFTGALGSTSINTEVYLYDNSPRSLAAFNQIVQHQDATIRSSLGQGDVLHVDEELARNASVLRNAGVDVQVIENH